MKTHTKETPANAEAEINAGAKIVAAEGQVSSELGEERIILSLEGGVYYGLNPVGARIWNLIQEPVTVRAVRDQLLEEYDVGRKQCERDLWALLQDLATHDLIEVREGTLADPSMSS